MSQKIREGLSTLPRDALVQSSADVLISGLSPSLLEITEQDIADCEVFAKRVGCQWEKVLRRKGYTEFADVVLELVQRDSILEGTTNQEDMTQNSDSLMTDKDGKQTDTLKDKFLTIDAALNSIQRYQPDCDGSGIPLKSLPKLSDVDSNGVSTARKAIQQIDQLMESFDSKTLRACYGYDWDAINEAVKRNKKRLYMFQRMDGYDKDEYEIVPKSLEQVDEADTDTGAVEGDPVDDDFLIATNTHAATILRRKRKREEKLQLKLNGSGNNAEVLHGRPPSAICETQWAWQDVLDAIPATEQQKLVREFIHDTSSMDEDQTTIICGSLKRFGHTHLWEETNAIHQIDHQSSSGLQKGAIRRAIKERIGPRTLITSDKRSELGEEVGGKKNISRTKWTLSSEAYDEENPRQWLELDLGDCTVEVADENSMAVQPKRILTFRSLELSLQF